MADLHAAPRVAIHVLSLTAFVAGRPVALQPRELEVLVALTLFGDGVDRESFAQWIWPDKPPHHARNDLKVYISRLRRSLGTDAIVSRRDAYMLAAHVAVDVTVVERVLCARRPVDARARAVLRLVARTRYKMVARAMGEWAWLAPRRTHLDRLARESRRLAIRDALERKRYDEALPMAALAFDDEPCDVASKNLLVAVQLALGDHRGAFETLHAHERAVAERALVAQRLP